MKNKKILIISPFCPCSPSIAGSNGGSPYWIIKNSKNCTIDLLYINEKNINYENDILKYCNTVNSVNFNKEEKTFKQFTFGILKGIPKICYKYNSKKYFNYIKENYFIDSYDNILVVSNELSGLIKFFDKTKVVFFPIDSFSLWYYRKSKIEKNILKKTYYYLQYKLFIKYEKKQIIDNTNRIVYVSEIDRKFEKEKLKTKNIYAITHGVEIPQNYEDNLYDTKSFNLVFSGQMSYEPNNDAVLYFIDNIFDRVKKYIPELKLYIVGKNPSEELQQKKNEDIVITGFVENIYSYIASGDVYISPLRFGTGVKNKILEAMSCKMAIIASHVSIEGIDNIKENVNYLEANSEEEWISNIKKLYNNRRIIENMKKTNYETVLKYFSWENTLIELMGWK